MRTLRVAVSAVLAALVATLIVSAAGAMRASRISIPSRNGEATRFVPRRDRKRRTMRATVEQTTNASMKRFDQLGADD